MEKRWLVVLASKEDEFQRKEKELRSRQLMERERRLNEEHINQLEVLSLQRSDMGEERRHDIEL
jgi:hypothetical protein